MKTTSIRILKLEVPDTRYEELRDFRHVDHHIVTCVNVREYLVSLVPKRQGQEMKEHVRCVYTCSLCVTLSTNVQECEKL